LAKWNAMSRSKLQSSVTPSALRFKQEGKPGCQVSFIRTLRIPDDGKPYRLPPGFGPFPLRRVRDYADKVPKKWLETDGVFLPIYQREAMWLSFEGSSWYGHAIKLAAGGVNALSGEVGREGLQSGGEDGQDYLVCPDQRWLDGFNSGEGAIRQFVAMPLGSGHTVEAQVTEEEQVGGLQLTVYPPKHDRPLASRSGRRFEPLLTYCPPPFVNLALERLVEEQHFGQEELDEVRYESENSQESLVSVLRRRKLVAESVLEEFLCRANAEACGMEFVELGGLTLDAELARLIPGELARRYGVFPISVSESHLTLAMRNPEDVLALEDIQLLTGCTVIPAQATSEAIEKAINQHYGVTDFWEREETVKDISAQDFCPGQEFGLAAAGPVTQRIYPDRHGIETWDQENGVSLHIHLVDIFTWARFTGEKPPSTPVNAKAYTDAGFPWFDIYDDTHTGDLSASEILAEVNSMAQMDAAYGLMSQADETLQVSPKQVVHYISSSKPIGRG
jgi:MshEN domain